MSGNRVPSERRRGFVLAGTIVCMLVASIVTASVMQRSVRHRLEVQRRMWQSQADWLAQAGLKLATQRITAAEDYQGETWRPQLDDARLSAVAKVEIEMLDRDGQRWIHVLVNYPDHPFQRAQSELRVALDDPKAGS